MKKILVAAILLFAFAGNAQTYVQPISLPLPALLTAVAMNGATATRTFCFGPKVGNYQVRGFERITMKVNYTYAAAGAMTTTCLGGATQATANATLTTCVGVGTCGLQDAGIFRQPTAGNLGASKIWIQRLNFGGNQAICCTIVHSGTATSSDLVTITGVLSSY